MPKQRILVVEDDKDISRLLQYNLEKADFSCTLCGNGEDALKVLAKQPFQLVILDIMMPGMDGWDVCRSIRQDKKLKDLLILMLTAKGEEVDRIVGLELGADDYVVKPFSPRELVLRVKAILRRSQPSNGGKDTIKAGVLSVDVSGHSVRVAGKDIDLTPREFNLLVLLMQKPGRVVTREHLLEEIWDIHSDVYTRTVDTHIKRLREKLGKAGKLIETVVGVGYRFREDSDEN